MYRAPLPYGFHLVPLADHSSMARRTPETHRRRAAHLARYYGETRDPVALQAIGIARAQLAHSITAARWDDLERGRVEWLEASDSGNGYALQELELDRWAHIQGV